MIEITLEKIDMVRGRTKVSYKEAKEALEKSDGNVVDAIIYIEDSKKKKKEELYISKEEFINWIKQLIKKGNINRIRILKDEKIMADIPVNAGVVATTVGLMISSVITLGVFTVALTQLNIQIIKDDGSVEVVNKIIKNTFADIKEKVENKASEVKDKVIYNKGYKHTEDNMCKYTVNFEDVDDKKDE